MQKGSKLMYSLLVDVVTMLFICAFSKQQSYVQLYFTIEARQKVRDVLLKTLLCLTGTLS